MKFEGRGKQVRLGFVNENVRVKECRTLYIP